MSRGSTHQGIPSTFVTASHVTQGGAEYESMIPRGMDEGLDLWEATSHMASFHNFSGKSAEKI
jgi:hypothetical protein